jgi:Cu2+-containing amine oxidase
VADEIAESEAAIKANPEFQALLRQWGITNLDMVMVDLDVPPQAKLSDHVCGSKDSDDVEKLSYKVAHRLMHFLKNLSR